MSATSGSTGASSNRGWMLYFWLVEGAFALIGGANEMWVYWAFTPPSQFSWPEAFMRAFVTQFAIVGFGMAGVKSYQLAGGGLRGIVAALPANAFALFFAFVTFWLMRISAVAFRNGDVLGNADSLSLWLPFVGDVDGKTVTLTIIAGVPFFQWALGVFGPIIVAEKRQMSAEEIKTKGEADLAQAEINARLALLNAKRVGGMFGGALQGAKSALSSGDTSDLSSAEGAGNGSGKRGLRIVGRGDSGPLSGQEASGLPAAKGPWKRDDVLAYVRLEYPQVSLSETAALDAVKEAGNGRMKGTSYVANITAVKAWARRVYGLPKSDLSGREVVAEVAG
jgi:hypothetical protein